MKTATKTTTQQEEFLFNLKTTWDLFYHDTGCLEVRALAKSYIDSKVGAWEGRGNTISGYFNDYDAFVRAVTALDVEKRIKGIYVTLNPCLSALMGRASNRLIAAEKGVTTSDNDIVSRRALLIDSDPFRPSELASTQEEMEAAIAKRDQVATYLYTQGFPPMPKAGSGNGAHLIGQIDLPNTAESTRTISDFLQCLNWKFGTVPDDSAVAKRQFAQGIINVGIDTTVFNAGRITKLYGTAVRKGDNTNDRPHRRAQFTHIPEQSEVIPAELLERIAQEWRDHKSELEKRAQPKPVVKSAIKSAFSTNGHTAQPSNDWWATVERVETWFAEHGINLGRRTAYTNDGYQYKWSVDCITSSEHKDGAVILWGADKGLGYKCHHNSCEGKGWADVRGILDPIRGNVKGTETGESVEPDLLLSVDEVLRVIGEIATDESLKSEQRKAKIVKELGFVIGELERTDHSLVVDVLEKANANFTKTDAKDFVRGCVADAKTRHKERQQQRKEEARENLLAVRAKKGKASIDVGNRQLSDIVDEALQVLVDSNAGAPTMFVRGGALVRIVQDERGHYGIQEFSNGAMLGKLAGVADWETVVVDADGNPQTKAVFPPKEAVTTILSAAEWPGIPALTGVVTSPVFSRNGALHDHPGYDPETRLFYTDGVKVGDTTPTPENIERAKDLILNNLLRDFPFKDLASCAHAFAYLLLPFARDMIDGPTPVHDVDSPTAGTGKGKLLNACAYPFLGHDVPTMAAAKDDDEWRKRLTSLLLNGSTHATIDNVNHELDSGSLASAFTQPVWEDRTLGSNRQVKIPIRTIWGITANNIKMSQELARRCIWIRLDANVEKPWERTGFKHKNLIGWAKVNRNALVTAALTLIQAWVDRGMPLYTKRTKGSYEIWAGVMGGILEAVGIDGFLDNETELYDRVVSKSDLMADFVKAWWGKFGNKDASAYELFKLASFSDSDADNAMSEWNNLLGDMLTSQKQRGRQTQLGNILNTHRDKVVAGYKIVFAKAQKGVSFWRLVVSGVEPQSEVLPTNEGSTQPLPPVDGGANDSWVEPSRTFLTRERVARENFSCLVNDTTIEDKKKNNSLYTVQGVEVLLGSTHDASTTCSNGVEPQPGSTQVLPMNDEMVLVGYDEDGEEIWQWM